MMTDYIKRTDAVKIAEKYGLANGSVLGRHTGLADCIARDISELPAADVAEVVHGQWLLDSRWPSWQHRECSRCKITFQRTTEVEDQYWQYCPNCGARMDGGNGECRGVTE